MNKDHNILILGLGNEILSDAGIALHLLNKLQTDPELKSLSFKSAPMFSADLLQTMEGHTLVFILDCLPGPPFGKLLHYGLVDFRPGLHLSNFHDHPFRQMHSWAAGLGVYLTENIHFITVRVKNISDFSESFSDEIQEKMDKILMEARQIILKEIHNAINHNINAFNYETF